MSKCILHGHTPIERAGVGEFEGRTFMVCAECGNTLAEFDPNPKQTLADLVDVMDYNESTAFQQRQCGNHIYRANSQERLECKFCGTPWNSDEPAVVVHDTAFQMGYHRNG